MRNDKLRLLAPAALGQPCNEAEALGGAVWLWMHSATHRNLPLHALPGVLMPAIKRGQFVLAVDGEQPVFFLSWTQFSQVAETRYLGNSSLLMPEADWNSGDRIWLLDFVAPFGHAAAMSRLLQRTVFPHSVMRMLYHRGNERGLRVKTFHGAAVAHADARRWLAANPIIWPESADPTLKEKSR